MKHTPFSSSLVAAGSTLAMVLLSPAARAQIAGQDIALAPGWNAVWLEVEPVYPAGHDKAGQPRAPGDVFPAGVQTVITPKPLAGTAEFFAEDPTNVGTFNQEGWEQWNSPSAPGDNLAIVTGNRPYLLKTTGALGFNLQGKVRFHRPRWAPDRYNLIGFGLQGTPTFESFFGPSGATHPTDRIYRLHPGTGNWIRIASPATATMVSHEAYWIFTSGPSNYMGPVAIDFDGAISGAIDFAGPSDAQQVDTGLDALQLDLEEIVFTNRRPAGGADAVPALDLITPDPDPGSLALHVAVPNANNLGYSRGNQVDSAAGPSPAPSALGETVPPQQSRVLTIGAARDWASGRVGRTNVYRLHTGGGNLVWLPISASNSDVLPPTDLLPTNALESVAGLWVGEATIWNGSAFVEDGGPVRPAAAPAPLRVLLHSDSAGRVRLLSQVTIMQTRTADPDVAPEPVLVVDRNRIPFFEGISERNGKRIGIRLDAVAFDMPRDISAAAQSDSDPLDSNQDLIDFIVAESMSPSSRWFSGANLYPNRGSVDEAAIDSYLLFRGLRPPTLKESYKLSLLLEGAIGSGKTVKTLPGTLTLDPFHRTNPFRHAFHQGHPKGPKVTRELTIVFDSEQSVPDRLTGTYQEDLLGITKSRLTLTGTIKMQRVSPVAALEGVQ